MKPLKQHIQETLSQEVNEEKFIPKSNLGYLIQNIAPDDAEIEKSRWPMIQYDDNFTTRFGFAHDVMHWGYNTMSYIGYSIYGKDQKSMAKAWKELKEECTNFESIVHPNGDQSICLGLGRKYFIATLFEGGKTIHTMSKTE
jgi:hypothetical protein